MEDAELAELLRQAVPKPAFLAITDGGPVLSLALHCLMIQAGFELASNAAHGRTTSKFVPPKDWNGALSSCLVTVAQGYQGKGRGQARAIGKTGKALRATAPRPIINMDIWVPSQWAGMLAAPIRAA